MNAFTIPVVLFIYQRYETTIHNLKILKSINAKKIYLLADYNLEEGKKKHCDLARKKIEQAIDWDCEVVKVYATENIGVHANIGLGSMKVFEKESVAIFLEDDCQANVSFFLFCKEMLERYKNNEKIVWINGTNYFDKVKLKNNESYGFHNQLLPCGWASWADKFLKFYDYDFKTLNSKNEIKKIKNSYQNKALYRRQKNFIIDEFERKMNGVKYRSWDFHMIYSIMFFDLMGICPKYNLIINTGVDDVSEHISKNKNDVMVKRFHFVPSHELEFPLVHPKRIAINNSLNRKIAGKILPPFKIRVKGYISKCLKKILGKSRYQKMLNNR